MDHFATKFKVPTENHVYKWKFCVPLIQLLMDIGGLPRALERLFIICFMKLCDNGEKFFWELESYDYDNFFINVKSDLEKMIPIDEDECLDEKLKITIVDVDLAKTFQVNNRMYLQGWELFMVHHISFQVNLAIKMGKDKLSLHPGAYGTQWLRYYYEIEKALYI
ncbi:hypothetical protein RhiirB3_439178 [Rhizophagus irregularis]|nr:hypothetical protein RhiirB3_439178 [Rhizophagus irregularis]